VTVVTASIFFCGTRTLWAREDSDATGAGQSRIPRGRRHSIRRAEADIARGEYDWQFIPEAGKQFVDSGTGKCH